MQVRVLVAEADKTNVAIMTIAMNLHPKGVTRGKENLSIAEIQRAVGEMGSQGAGMLGAIAGIVPPHSVHQK